jgi:hypothetical protein
MGRKRRFASKIACGLYSSIFKITKVDEPYLINSHDRGREIL